MIDSAPESVGIRSVGRFVPDTEISNEQLVERFDTTDEWIRRKLGIHTRRVAAPDQSTSDLAVGALYDACARAGVAPDSLDLVICCTGTPDHMLPAMAAAVLRKANLLDIRGFDVNAGGCAGGVFALDVGVKYIRSGEYHRVAVVIADTVAQCLDPEDRTAHAIFGDGAACYLLEACRPGRGIGPTLMRTRPELYYTAFTERLDPPGGFPNRFSGPNYMRMDGGGVRDFALDVIPDFAEQVVKAAGTTLDEVDLIVSHQANPTLLRRLMAELGQPETKTVVVADRLGNTSGSSVVLALADAVDHGRLNPGDDVLVVSFGSGMSYGGTVVRWCGPEDFGGEPGRRG
ncbi:3-oxoacyl-[acyl-carrier-protein] synthase-3 [Streptomyces sp. yr375]|uniref:3-oxoacyl-ACP synthase III family protein n=1 Tax=Streptomyces sp. yr375 TaxID=1761906 RepID=UPI0008D6CD76|nr:ketoacyl-ACP synthase III [Streptomyces sp. yr375]SEQ48196.1 3-oxoacyl-[acyl-carrier-protein] synthase-3 [Streptomyces sp. yr375]